MDRDQKLSVFLDSLGENADVDFAREVLAAADWDLQTALEAIAGGAAAPALAAPAVGAGAGAESVRSPMRTGYRDTLLGPGAEVDVDGFGHPGMLEAALRESEAEHARLMDHREQGHLAQALQASLAVHAAEEGRRLAVGSHAEREEQDMLNRALEASYREQTAADARFREAMDRTTALSAGTVHTHAQPGTFARPAPTSVGSGGRPGGPAAPSVPSAPSSALPATTQTQRSGGPRPAPRQPGAPAGVGQEAAAAQRAARPVPQRAPPADTAARPAAQARGPAPGAAAAATRPRSSGVVAGPRLRPQSPAAAAPRAGGVPTTRQQSFSSGQRPSMMQGGDRAALAPRLGARAPAPALAPRAEAAPARAAAPEALAPSWEQSGARQVAAQSREAERREAERLEAARLEAARLEAARLEAQRREAERQDAQRREAARAEAERLEAERREAERLEAERLGAERREAERREEERRAAACREAERRASQSQEGERQEPERPRGEGGEAAQRGPELQEVVPTLVALRRRYLEADPSGLATCLQTLRTLLGNLAHHPQEAKFQRIRGDTSVFQTRIAAFEGATDVLRACGFDEVDGAWVADPAFLKTKGPRLFDALAKVDVMLDQAKSRCG